MTVKTIVLQLQKRQPFFVTTQPIAFNYFGENRNILNILCLATAHATEWAEHLTQLLLPTTMEGCM